MANRLSHSAINKFLQCGESYRLHYREGYRPIEIGSALIFGSAIGKAFEFALKKETELPNIATPKEMFDYYWAFQEINGALTNLQTYPNIAYSRYDLDKELADTPYESLRVKAHLMLDTFEKEFLPLVTKVWSTEEKIELSNDEGDSSIGFADAVVNIIGYDKPVIIDFKTASRPYEQDSAATSVQLSQYLHVLSEKYDNTRYVGYVVFLKNISKNRIKVCSNCGHDGSGTKFKSCNNEINGDRCGGAWTEVSQPKADMQIIISEISQNFETFIIDNISAVNTAIKSNIFVKNVNNCKDLGYGRPCEFYNLCHGSSEKGLVKVEVKK